MGVYLGLEIMPHCIGNDEWHEAYEDSLALLKAWPDPLMGIERERRGSLERTVYSRQLEHGRDDPSKRHWHVVGDFKTKETGESFVLHYDLNHYLSGGPRPSKSSRDSDIIAILINEDPDYRKVFCEKTQGHLYHFPILGVAMLIEARFPRHAHASGDIDIHQAKRAQDHVRAVTGKALDLPVCVDAGRLLQRIQRHCHGKEAVKRFLEVHRGGFREGFKALHSMCANDFAEWFVDKLRSYRSPGQLGAIDLCMDWLGATRDLRTLCETACIRDDGPRFDPVGFAGALASTWISVDESLRGVLGPFRKPEGEAGTVMSQLGSALFDIGGLKGRDMEFHMNEEDILEVFSRLFPDRLDPMRQAFKAKAAAIKGDLEECREGAEQWAGRCEEEPEPGDGSSVMALESFGKASPRQKAILETVAWTAARARSMILAEQPGFLEGPADRLIERIAMATERHGLTLTEDAWKWLDRESGQGFLQYLLSLAAIGSHEQAFWNARKGMLENRDLCLAAFEMSNDEAFLAKMEALGKDAAGRTA